MAMLMVVAPMAGLIMIAMVGSGGDGCGGGAKRR